MITKITSVQELKQIFLEIFLNKTDKVTDVGQESVLNGIAYGCAKVGEKCLVNQSVVEGHIFPDTAYGDYLDNLAAVRGVSPRFKAQGSSTYVRITAERGTQYSKDATRLTATNGTIFYLENDVEIDINGYAYVKVYSGTAGARTNVDPLTINKISPIPRGHMNVTNEYRATGGRDEEDDNLFRQRIKDSVNQLARTTLSYLEQVFMKINPRVLRLRKNGIDADGKFCLTVVPINGVDFSEEEFNQILSLSQEYLSLNEVLNERNDFRLRLLNVDWLPIDVEFRVDIDPAYDPDAVRREIQIQMGKLFDYRYWKYGNKVEWDDMLQVVKQVDGVRYVPDTHFYPNSDINVQKYRLPRLRAFIMRDLDGNIIEDNNGVMADVFYPSEYDDAFIGSVLRNI